MNKKEGFTLVELIAVIGILTIILTIAVPSLINNIKGNKESASLRVQELIKTAAKNYEIDYNVDRITSIPISDLCGRYIECPIIDPSTNEEISGYITIGSDKNDVLNAATFNVNFNGGTSSQVFEDTYPPYTTISMEPPLKEGYVFSRWVIVKGNGTIDGNNVTIGDRDMSIYALWENKVTLTIDLDGGLSNQEFDVSYRTGTTITLEEPTKAGYTFKGWTITEGNSTLSGNIITVGSEDTTLTATWESNNLIISYACANESSGSNNMFTYTGNCSIIDDSNGNWRIKFLTSGTFTPKASVMIDVFAVGGGGKGVSGRAGGGGGGGYTTTAFNKSIENGSEYEIIIGGQSGTSSGFGVSALGGSSGGSSGGAGGSGGGGDHGRGGSDGGNGSGSGGLGQGTTTREFGEATGELYAGGGAGGNASSGSGGAGGGGNAGANGQENTGGGGGACKYAGHVPGDGSGVTEVTTLYGSGGAGGSGIVIIRNAR